MTGPTMAPGRAPPECDAMSEAPNFGLTATKSGTHIVDAAENGHNEQGPQGPRGLPSLVTRLDAILYAPGLSPTQRVILLRLVRCMDYRTGMAIVSQKRMAIEHELNTVTVRRAMTDLEKLGYIALADKVKRQTAGRGHVCPVRVILPSIDLDKGCAAHPIPASGRATNCTPSTDEKGCAAHPIESERGAQVATKGCAAHPSLYKTKEQDKEEGRTATGVIIPPALRAPEFADAWGLWIDHCTELGKRLTRPQQQAQLEQLSQVGPDDAAAEIRRAIANRQYTLFRESNHGKATTRRTQTRDRRAGHQGLGGGVPVPVRT